MTGRKGARHLTALELAEIATWISECAATPTWSDVAVYVEQKYGVRRSTEALRRRSELKSARDAVKTSASEKPPQRNSAKKVKTISIARYERLKLELDQVRTERDQAIERSLALHNAMRRLGITESEMERSLDVSR